MLILCVVAFIATTAFLRQAKLAGVHPGKAASIPFLALGFVLIVEYLIVCITTEVALAFELSDNSIEWILLPMHLFMVLAYLALVRSNWILLASRVIARISVVPKDLNTENMTNKI
jgi:hypothetical protein